MIKQSINFVLLVLVFLFLFTPLITVQAEYFTGYLDFTIPNIGRNFKSKIATDLSLFLKNNIKNEIFFTIKYDKNHPSNKNHKRDSFLDRSILLKDFSHQKEYMRVNYKKYEMSYGDFNYKLKTPLFFNYNHNFKGVKLKRKGEKLNVKYFLNKSNQVKISDYIINPSTSHLYLSNRDIVRNSESIYINILNKKNELIKITSLNGNQYEINYLEGMIIFSPVIFFLNNPDFNYELIINYKIRDSGYKYLDKGYQVSSQLFKKCKLKLYDLSEKEVKTIRGASIKYSPDKKQNYILEYQQIKDKKSNINISSNNGDNYFNEISEDKTEEKVGFKYYKKFTPAILLKGHNYQTKIIDKQNKYKEVEHFIEWKGKVNEKQKATLSYLQVDNNLNTGYYQYRADLISQIKPRIKLNTKANYKINSLDEKPIKSLDNFFEVKFSENSYTYWGYLQNLTTGQYYPQYGIDYFTKTGNIFSYKNKVKDTEYRIEKINYKNKNGFELFKHDKSYLTNYKPVKKSRGIRYKVNKTDHIVLTHNRYSRAITNIENIIKYQMNLKSKFKVALNYLEHYKKSEDKNKGIRGSINYNNGDNLFIGSYETMYNKSDINILKRVNISYKSNILPNILFMTHLIDNKEIDAASNLYREQKSIEARFKYKFPDKKHLLICQYEKELTANKEKNIKEKNISQEYLFKFLYNINQNLAIKHLSNYYSNKQYLNGSQVIKVINLNRLGIVYNLNKNWLMNLEYRTLQQNSKDRIDDGFLISARKKINENYSISLLYNFTDFNNDISQLNYTNKGLSLNLNYKW